MRQCLTRRLCLRPLQRLLEAWSGPVYLRSPRVFVAALSTRIGNKAREPAPIALNRDGFRWTNFLEGDAKHDVGAWSRLLENALPPRLREKDTAQGEPDLKASHVAEIILAARRVRDEPGTEFDLLFHLGVDKGRWRAVVWLVKLLLDAFAPVFRESGHFSKPPRLWTSEKSLHELTRKPISPQILGAHASDGHVSPSFHSLDETTDGIKTEKFSREYLLCQGILGSIWQSLGKMTIACADGDIQPEILEIIAYLHHMEIMPTSIYNQRPSVDPEAIQQPFMLSLFSSRILTSLSDAAWRAHEKLVVEEAKAKGGKHVSLRPEIPGTAYRVNVAGLRSEVWLELILWSCLHRGWISEGTAILRALCNEPKPREWRPLSWRSLVSYAERDQDWDKLEYVFNTQRRSAVEVYPFTTTSVRRTISSEAVNAYVDALLSTVRLGVGERGAAPNHVIAKLQFLHKFLQRSHMSLETASWDAIVLRLVDYQENLLHQKDNFDRLISLSPSMGEELQSNDKRQLPAYVLDGSAAVLGLFHRAIRSRINAGDVHAALRLFEALQILADKNKRRSVADFFQKQQKLAGERNVFEESPEMFTNYTSGIEYPAFDMQIPTTVLGPFLDLALDAKAHNFAKWLVYSDEVDGPVILEHHYGDPAITPALVRFAAEVNDTTLLSKLIQASSQEAQLGEKILPRTVLLSFFESQVNLKRWDAAVRILQHIKQTHYSYWNFISLAHVIRTMLLQVRGADRGDQQSVEHLHRAKTLLSDMVQGKYEREGERPQVAQDEITMLLIMLSTLNRTWSEYCLALQPLGGLYAFQTTTKAFNLVLGGVVDAYGSIAGRNFLDTFWSQSIREAQSDGMQRSRDGTEEPAMSRYVPSILDEPERRRTVVQIPTHPVEEAIFYGGLKPDLMTIQIIFLKAIDELKRSEELGDNGMQERESSLPMTSEVSTIDTRNTNFSAEGMIIWAMTSFRSLGMMDEDIADELGKALSGRELRESREKLLELFKSTNHDEEDTCRNSEVHRYRGRDRKAKRITLQKDDLRPIGVR